MLRRLKIRSKLVAVLLAPAIALAVLAVIVIRPLLGDVRAANAVTRYAQLASTVNPLVHDLQLEAGLSAQFLAAKQSAVQATLTKARTNTDGSATAFLAAVERVDDLPTGLAADLQAAKADVNKLATTRTAADRAGMGTDELQKTFGTTVGKLLDFQRNFLGERSLENPELHRLASAYVELSLAKDALSQERTLLALAMARGVVDRATYGQLNRLVEAYDDHIARFVADAADAERSLYGQVKTGADATTTQAVETLVLGAVATETSAISGDPVAYFNAMTARLEGLKRVEIAAGAHLRSEARAALSTARQKAISYGAGLAMALALAIALAALVSRSLTRPVRQLTEGASEIAAARLPALVEQIQTSDHPVDVTVVPIRVDAGGELGQLAEAFNAVQEVAVATAVEQAQLRRSIASMFVNLGRRSQTLVDRQLELIDQLENNEKDPDSLNDLFALDHLATRMRRNAENLLVLAGQEPPRKWGQSLPLVDVIRAAVSEVEDYTRVDVLAQEDLFLAGHAATDLAHLVAELVENATNFSPPTTRVRVRVERADQRYLISVIDQGIGMTDGDLATTNARLSSNGLTEIALTNRIGFFVIGRLARRVGVAVRLGRSSGGGVIAQVALPPTLVTTSRDETPGAPQATAEPDDTLADSPQSARERLLGALRTVEPGREPAFAPAETFTAAPPSLPVAAAPAPAAPMAPGLPTRGATAPPAAPAPARELFAPDHGWTDELSAPAIPTAPAAPIAPPAPVPTVPPAPAPAGWGAPGPVPVPPAPRAPALAGGPAPAAPSAPVGPIAPPVGAVPAAPLTPGLAGAAAAMQMDSGVMQDRRTAADGLASLLASMGGGLGGLAGAPHGVGATAGAPDPTTPAGLPQRTAGTSRRPNQQITPPATEAAQPARSADDVRSMLSRFRTGVERGRQLPDPTTPAASTPEDRP